MAENLDPNKMYLEWSGSSFPNSSSATFKAPAGSTIDWGDGTVETFDADSTQVNTHTYNDGINNHLIGISGVTSIGRSAFHNCSSLASVEIGDSVTSIDDWAFSSCSKLTSVTIPNSVTSIGEYAFRDCISLTSVVIGGSVTSIGEGAFSSCHKVTNIEVSADNTAYQSIDGNLYTKDGNTLIQYAVGKTATTFTIPDGVTSIGTYAFSGCSSLTSVVIGNSVTSIGDRAFQFCYSLTSVVIGDNVTSIGDWAFSNCGRLMSIEVSVDNATYQSIDGNLYTKDGTTFIQYTIGKKANSFTIPNSVTSIGGWAFSNCRSLTSVVIPDSVTSIGNGAFSSCSSLTSVTLGTSVKVIEKNAFEWCEAIETITCYSMRPPTVNNGAFEDLDYSTIVYVPADYLNTYKMHDFWGIYDVRPIGASKTETTEVKVEPTENTAEVAWPAVSGAATYELVIKDKGGNVICTLIFNAQGQLTQIAFNAPSRNNAPQQTQAAGFSFTVTGLEEGTSYDLTITSKDNNGGTLDTKTVSFTTTGEPQGIEDVLSDQVQCTKVIREGQILILRGEKVYSLTGQEVR